MSFLQKKRRSTGKQAHLSTVRDHFSGESARPPDPDSVILLTHAAEIAPRLQPTFSWVAPTMADFRPGGFHRFGASLRSQCRSRGVWVPRSFFTASCSLGALQTAATLDKQILDYPLCACPCSHTEPSLYYNSIAGACQPAAPIICGLYSAFSCCFQLLAHLFHDLHAASAELAASSAAPARNSFFFITVSSPFYPSLIYSYCHFITPEALL